MLNYSSPTLELLLENNQGFIQTYQKSALMQLVNSEHVTKKECRTRMLDLIQTLSNYFQKIILLRSALADNDSFSAIALDHLKEEFCHHEQLLAERNYQPAAWDVILEATCSWFTWKMFTSSDEEKTVLIHLILEASGNIFFQAAHKVMQKYDHIEYFRVHSEVDEHHEKMGIELLKNLSPAKYKRLLEVQQQGWQMMVAACDRIATLSIA